MMEDFMDHYHTAETAIGKHCFVSAGAGAGKTTVLTKRYANAVEQGARPKEILALTFTRKAAAEMRDRIRQTLLAKRHAATNATQEVALGEAVEALWAAPISTFHSFFSDLLRRFALDANLSPSFVLIEPAARAFEIQRHVAERLGDIAHSTGDERDALDALLLDHLFDYTRILRTLVELAAAPQANADKLLAAFANGDGRDILSKLGVLLEAVAPRQSPNALDYSQLETKALETLQNTTVAARIRKAFGLKHLFVDEYQDTNLIQREVIFRLAGASQGNGRWTLPRDAPKLLVVGDPKQSIYRFRGAEVEVFSETAKDFAAMPASQREILDLGVCKRSTPELVDFFNFVFDDAEGVFSRPGGKEPCGFEPVFKPLDAEPKRSGTAKGAESTKVGCHIFRSAGNGKGDIPDDVGTWIANQIAALKASGAYDYKDMAILMFSVAKAQDELGFALNERGIPSYTVGLRGLLNRPEVQDFLSWLRALARPDDHISLAACAKQPCVGVTDRMLLRLATVPADDLEWRGDGDGHVPKGTASRLLWTRFKPGRCDEPTRQALDRFQSRLDALAQTAASANAADVASAVVALNQMLPLWAAHPDKQEARRCAANIEAFLRQLRTSQAGAADLFTFHELLEADAVLDSSTAEAQLISEDDNVVRIMSIHQSKGLEFKVVFVADIEKLDGSGFGDPGILSSNTDGAFQIRFPKPTNPFEDVKEGDDLGKLKDAAEKRRLFYVALTRAMDRLFICGAARITKDFNKDSLPKFNNGAAWILKRFQAQHEGDEKIWPIPAEGDAERFLFNTLPVLDMPLAAAAPAVAPSPALPLEMPKFQRLETITPSLDKHGSALPVPVALHPPAACPVPMEVEGWQENDLGTLVHGFLYRWNFDPQTLENTLDAFILANAPGNAAVRRFVERCVGNLAQISWYGANLLSTFRQARSEGRLKRENPFEYNQLETELLVQAVSGIIDVQLLLPDGSLQVFDYKTGEQPPAHYAVQMRHYRTAVERLHPGVVVHPPLLVYFNPLTT